MDNLNQLSSETKNKLNEEGEKIKNKTSDVYHDVRDKIQSKAEHVKEAASDMYKGGKKQLHGLEQNFEEYSDELINKVREKPLTSLLIAVGVGFILSKIIKK